ncbi:hypothetical protein CC2G_008338 [Coprinopsis cinerea AmutBmut pab1-1]|nr:hypothetical protein CC2G_008338 [Coprinopsis cinerea AmutBmut pab1-1]
MSSESYAKRRFMLSNYTIESTGSEVDLQGAQLVMTVVGAGGGEVWLLKSVENSRDKWELDPPAVFIIPGTSLTALEIVFVLRNGEGQDIGHARIESGELDSLVFDVRRKGKQDVARDFSIPNAVEGTFLRVSMEFDIMIDPAIHPFDMSDPDALEARYVTWIRTIYGITGQFRVPGKVQEANDCISFLRSAMHSVSKLNPFTTHLTALLAMTLNYRFKSTGNTDDLNDAIDNQERLLEAMGRANQDTRIQCLTDLVAMLRMRHSLFKTSEDLDRAVAEAKSATVEAGENVSNLLKSTESLVAALVTRQTLEDLEEASNALERLVEFIPEDSPVYRQKLVQLGAILDLRHQPSRDDEIFAKMYHWQSRLVQLTPDDDPGVVPNLRALQEICLHRGLVKEPDDAQSLDHAIELARTILHLPFESMVHHPPITFTRQSIQIDLAHCLHQRFRRAKSGDRSDVDEAIEIYTEVVDNFEGEEGQYPMELLSLANCYESRYERLFLLEDIVEAISYGKKAINLMTDANHPRFTDALGSLVQYLHKATDRTERAEYVDEAVAVARRALDLAPEGHPKHDFYSYSYAMALASRFERYGDLHDIEEALPILRRLVQHVPETERVHALYVGGLSTCLLHRFSQSQDLADLNQCISYQQKAISFIPEDDENRLISLSTLASAYQLRYNITKENLDILEAVSVSRQIVEGTPSGNPLLPSRLHNFAAVLYTYYNGEKHTADLQAAINAVVRAMGLCSQEDPAYPKLLVFGSSLMMVWITDTKPEGDLLKFMDEPISFLKNALDHLPAGHPERVVTLKNLGNAYRRRFNAGHDVEDVKTTISYLKEAADNTSVEDADIASIWLTLGHDHVRVYEAEKKKEDLDIAISFYRKAATSTVGSPETRMHAARWWAVFSIEAGHPSDDTLEAFGIAINLLSRVADLELTVENRHSRLSNASHLSLEAAATALTFSRPDKALEWLEQGRCLVWSQINNLRKPVDELRDRDPGLAARVVRVSRDLERAAARRNKMELQLNPKLYEKVSLQNEITRHVQLAREWTELLKTVRGMPGFEEFLLPEPCSRLLKHLPSSGVVVVINVFRSRCDALVLSSGSDTPLHIPLLEFSLSKAEKLRDSLKRRLSSSGLRMREAFDQAGDERAFGPKSKLNGRLARENVLADALRQLWICVAKPVLDVLELPRAIFPTKRIWWCTTGPLAFLPLHAAGIYGAGKENICVADFAVSSYAPTVSSITERVRKGAVPPVESQGLFLVSQPSVQGLPPIPGTTKEVKKISDLASTHAIRNLSLEGKDSPVDVALKKMAEYSCIHFACHAVQDMEDALESGFFMYDRRLNLSTIIESNLENSDLAFLSACQTSAGNESFAEEAVHLAAGMLAAGYRGVVATMWSIADGHAPMVAEEFYRRLFEGEAGGEDGGGACGSGITGSAAAFALHYAVGRLRDSLDESEASLLAWMPYVHFGL